MRNPREDILNKSLMIPLLFAQQGDSAINSKDSIFNLFELIQTEHTTLSYHPSEFTEYRIMIVTVGTACFFETFDSLIIAHMMFLLGI